MKQANLNKQKMYLFRMIKMRMNILLLLVTASAVTFDMVATTYVFVRSSSSFSSCSTKSEHFLTTSLTDSEFNS